MARLWIPNFLEKYRQKYLSSCEFPLIDLFMFILKASIAVIHLFFSVFLSDSHKKNLQHQVGGFFSFALHVDIPTTFIPAISTLCLLMKRKKYSKMVSDLNTIGDSLGIRMTSSFSKRLHWLFATVLLSEIIYELSKEWCHMINTLSVYTYYLFVYLKWHLVLQLANQLHILRLYYRHVTERLNIQRVEKFVKYHEILRSCCIISWECYKIQMSVIVIYVFIAFVCNVYLVVVSYSRHGSLYTYHYIYLFWIILYSSFTWLAVYSCAATKNMVRK